MPRNDLTDAVGRLKRRADTPAPTTGPGGRPRRALDTFTAFIAVLTGLFLVGQFVWMTLF